MPSRAMLMTGHQLFAVDDQMNVLPNDGEQKTPYVTFPELLGKNGYTTFGTGKWHNGEPSWLRSFQHGKSIMFGGMSDHNQVPLKDLNDDGQLSEHRTGDRHSSEMFADEVIQFIEGYTGDQPFLCYAAFTAPHDPRDPPVNHREYYYDNRPPLPTNFLPQHPFDNGELVLRDEVLAAWPRTRETVSDQLAEYYGLISHLDEQFGRIFDTLASGPHADNTIIIYAADHGLAVGSHGLLGKQSLYEHSMRCPLIIAGPNIPQNQSSQSFTYLFDLYPTICDLIGIKPPVGLAGHSLTPVIHDRSVTIRDTVFLAYRDLMRSVRTERWKLIKYPQVNHTQLFDLENDPAETKNLAGDSNHQSKLETLTATMKEWQQSVNDTQALQVESPQPLHRDLTGITRKPDRWQPTWIVEKYFDPSEIESAESVK